MLEPLRHSLVLRRGLLVHDYSYLLGLALAHLFVPAFPVLLLANITAVCCVLATRADEQAAILALALAALHVHGRASLLLVLGLVIFCGHAVYEKKKLGFFSVCVRFTRKRRKSKN